MDYSAGQDIIRRSTLEKDRQFFTTSVIRAPTPNPIPFLNRAEFLRRGLRIDFAHLWNQTLSYEYDNHPIGENS
jgi:hypothetical protein